MSLAITQFKFSRRITDPTNHSYSTYPTRENIEQFVRTFGTEQTNLLRKSNQAQTKRHVDQEAEPPGYEELKRTEWTATQEQARNYRTFHHTVFNIWRLDGMIIRRPTGSLSLTMTFTQLGENLIDPAQRLLCPKSVWIYTSIQVFLISHDTLVRIRLITLRGMNRRHPGTRRVTTRNRRGEVQRAYSG